MEHENINSGALLDYLERRYILRLSPTISQPILQYQGWKLTNTLSNYNENESKMMLVILTQFNMQRN